MIKETFDTTVKRAASRKPIIALILRNLLEEFNGMSIQDILSHNYIEPPRLGEPADPDDDAQYQTRIVGACGETNEDGTVAIYDILLDVKTPQNTWLRVNIEIQNQNERYNLVKRIVYYLSREVSAQKGRGDFVKSNYDALRGACSVWICIHPYAKDRGSVAKISLDLSWLRPEGKTTDPEDAQKIKRLMRGYIVNLPRPDVASDPDDWLNTLSVLFGHEISLETKGSFLKAQGIVKDPELTEDMNKMTTLDEIYRKEIREEERAKAIAEARAEVEAKIRAEAKAEARAEVSAEVRAETMNEARAESEADRKALLTNQVRNLTQKGFDAHWIANTLCASLTEVREILAANPTTSSATA